MMNELQIFNYEDKQIRVIQKDGESWWVAKDICEVFGETNRNRAMQTLGEDEKGYTQTYTPGGKQQMAIVNESGLYSLLFAMQPEKARGVSEEYIAERQKHLKNFKRWVTHEVLPTIRRHGMYATEELLNNPDFMIKVAEALKSERHKNKQLAIEVSKQQEKIKELAHKASYYDSILANPKGYAITQFAKDYGMSGQRMNTLLHKLRVQYRVKDQWVLYAKYQNKVFTHSHTHATLPKGKGIVMETRWTQKGRIFLYELLKSKGILPLIEQEGGNPGA